MKIYHNPRCSKSRATLALLQENGVEAEIVLYLQDPPNVKELKAIAKALDVSPRGFLRKGEAPYKDLQLADEGLSDAAIFEAMAAHPILMERPIVMAGARAVIGRPPENVLALLKD